MKSLLTRRFIASLGLGLSLLMAGCASTPQIDPVARNTLAPTGSLRVGVYLGSPTSLVNTKAGEKAGVAHDLGHALGKKLGVPVQIVEFGRLALVLDAIKAGQVDFTFTNATESRARDMDFTAPLLRLELGYLAMQGGSINTLAQVDQQGVRVGVSEGSTSQGVLTRELKNARVIPAASLKQAQQMLSQGQIDVFATNKAILFEMSDELPRSRVLDTRWGFENLAIGIPKGRMAAMSTLQEFAKQVASNGQLAAIVSRAGLRGTAKD